mgnify:CR=1 FL=1
MQHFVISCESCAMDGTAACADCVVTHLLAPARRELQSVSPGNYPKFASLELIYSEHFPADWQGRAVTCDFRANRVTSFFVEESGAGYVTKQGPDLLRTTQVSRAKGTGYLKKRPMLLHQPRDMRTPVAAAADGVAHSFTCTAVCRFIPPSRPCVPAPVVMHDVSVGHDFIAPPCGRPTAQK